MTGQPSGVSRVASEREDTITWSAFGKPGERQPYIRLTQAEVIAKLRAEIGKRDDPIPLLNLLDLLSDSEDES